MAELAYPWSFPAPRRYRLRWDVTQALWVLPHKGCRPARDMMTIHEINRRFQGGL